MKEVSRDFAHKTSPWRKAIAVITATALVASMSNIQAFGAPEEEPLAVDQTVTVRFDADPGLVVRVAGKDIAQQGYVCEAKTAYDLPFTVEAIVQDSAVYQVGAVSYLFNEKQDTTPEDESSPIEEPIETPALENPSDSNGSDPIDEPVASDNDISVDDSTVVPDEDISVGKQEPTQPITTDDEETLTDEVTPLAASPVVDSDSEATSDDAEDENANVSESASLEGEDGAYLLTKDTLASAADKNKEIVVRVTAEEIGKYYQVSTWEELKSSLKINESCIVELIADITAPKLETLEVKGMKNIELNGHSLSAGEAFKDSAKSLILVGPGAQLSLTDKNSVGIKPRAKGFEKTTEPDTWTKNENWSETEKWAQEELAQSGSYNAETKVLTYYMSTSDTDRSTGTSSEERATMELDMHEAGSIVGEGLFALIKVRGGNFSMSGGLLANTNGHHAINADAVQGTSVNVTVNGGFIVGNGRYKYEEKDDGDGAGIRFDGKTRTNSTLTISGTAVVAQNIARAGSKNGGGLWANNCTVTVGGEAVIANNYAGDPEECINGGTGGNGFSDNKHYGKYNGGGVYIKDNADLVIQGAAVISGNRAANDGGGVYVKPSSKLTDSSSDKTGNSLLLKEKANISNNRAMRDMSDWNPKDTPAKPDSSWWNIFAGGGGGIFSMGITRIDGGQIVNNFASDAGGGLLLPGEGGSGEAKPDLFVESTVIAGNYCDYSEGGGIFCHPDATLKDKVPVSGDSYIKRGFITNNATGTAFDYGGGGLFLESGGYLRVYSPLVTANTAQGWGGGVAACTNGTVITSDAAIFDNTANQNGHTTNENEFGDAWASDQGYWYNKEFGGLKTALPEGSSNDFFCAKQSAVFNDMLGGGSYNWWGFMSGRATTIFKRIKYGQAELSFAPAGSSSRTTLKCFNTGMDPNTGGTQAFVDSSVEKYAWIYVPKETDLAQLEKDLLGTYLHPINMANAELSEGGVILEMKKYDDGGAAGYVKLAFRLDFDAPKPEYQADTTPGGALYDKNGNPTTGATFYKTLKATLSTGTPSHYNIYQINQFPENGYASATRFMALKAKPTLNQREDPEGEKTGASARQAAFSAATVFFAGNYSDNNGGGIGCNGKIVIGREPGTEDPDEPSPPEEKYFDLTINKSWSNLDDLKENQNGPLTAVFKVVVYKSRAHYEANKTTPGAAEPVFETVLAMTFDKDSEAEQERLLEHLKEGWYVVVEEIGSAGDNFETDASHAEVGMDANITMKFKNTYKDEGAYSTSVVNSYAKGATEVEVTQDALYLKRTTKVETDTPEESEPSTEETPAVAAN